MNPVEHFLRNEIGLDAASIGPTTVERAVRSRMKCLGLKKPADYHRLLESSPAEREELIEAVVVPETWFFRDGDLFAVFRQLALRRLFQNKNVPLRILSVPCSSGEEPYSLAMCLLDAFVPPQQFVIDAVDISARTLARAMRAVYGRNSFRGRELAFRDRHFGEAKDGFALNASVRHCVRFQQDNLLNPAFLAGRGPYQFIFCRNLLIYFDRPTQIKSLETLRLKLSPDGLVFVGPAELPIFLENGFVPTEVPAALASPDTSLKDHRLKAKGSNFSIEPLAFGLSPSDSRSHKTAKPPPQRALRMRPPAPASRAADSAADTAATNLEFARQLADAGKLTEASAICNAHLRHHGPSGQAFYLLGLVLDAAGDSRAAGYYRKALYLEPNHFEALWHMALLLEKNGDREQARAFKRRAERAQKSERLNAKGQMLKF